MSWPAYPSLQASFQKIAVRGRKTWFSILALLILVIVACNMEYLLKKPPTYTFIPFTAADCTAAGLPAPSLASVGPARQYLL